MAKLDPGLKFLASASSDQWADIAADSAFGVDATVPGPPRANVLAEVVGSTASVQAAGLAIRTRVGNVVSGDIPIDSIAALENATGLRRAEVSRVLTRELDLAVPEARVTAVHTGVPPRRGAGVIVGLIDSGIDYQHPSFRDAAGNSRILAIWDQLLRPAAGTAEANPAAFTYGVEYTQANINTALQAANPLLVVRHVDNPSVGFHGTHVAGIAAGSGQPIAASGGALRFVGVAPEADLIVVANNRGRAQNERGLGDSADTLDAINYILTMADALGRPVVINMSQGDNVGPHDGTSLLEVGMSGLITGAGHVLVKSAGNEGDRNRHAQGTIAANANHDVRIQVPNNVRELIVDIWYPAADRISLGITPAGAGATMSAAITPPSTSTITLSNGNQAFVDADLNDPGNGDNRTFVILRPGNGVVVQPGVWTFRLRGVNITSGVWHAWIQRNVAAQFLAPFVNRATTISIPGTSAATITAGAYVSNGANTGSMNGTLSTFSSRGPTRDGRRAPTLSAPGEELMSTQPAGAGTFGPNMGTSMASPMVAGTVALMLEIDPTQTAADIRTCLESTARLDGQTGAAANNDWGAGKLDANAACQCAAAP
jgi:subtilisin family serine protease